jgi:hypothetical protein
VTPATRVAIIDSGIHAGHPHIGHIAGGVAIASDGSETSDFVDRIGHGTAVAAVIREKAPDAELYAVKIFDRKLSTDVDALVHAIRWCAAHEIRWVNLSLGTANSEHAGVLQKAVDEARIRGAAIVSAAEWLPGSLPGAIPVLLDWDCPREEYRIAVREDGRKLYRASGYPRPIPGAPPELNLKGISFAVANVTGLLASQSPYTVEV